MSATEVEEVLAVESGSNLIDVQVVQISCESGALVARVGRNLTNTSFLVFTERIDESVANQRRIALIKLGPDLYYPLEKDKTIVYRVDRERYLLPATSSTPPDQYLVVTLHAGPTNGHIRRQIDEVFAFFSTLVEEVRGASPELDAVRALLGIEYNYVSCVRLQPVFTIVLYRLRQHRAASTRALNRRVCALLRNQVDRHHTRRQSQRHL